MKVLLIDKDGKFPNLALMKISAFHKAKGDEVGFSISDPDIIYGSIVFNKNALSLSGLQFMHPDAQIHLGGPGHDLHSHLPDEVEFIKPDYSLYDGMVCQKCGNLIKGCGCTHGPVKGNMFYSLGFTTRGCFRKCFFCVVPIKEGPLVRWQHPSLFHQEDMKKINLLDNNWLADKEWFFETSQWIINRDLTLIENGMDIRLVDDKIAERLADLTFHKNLMHFAFDFDNLEDEVRRGVKTLKDAGIDIRHFVQFYVYLQDDKHFDSALNRCNILRSLNTNPFVMCNQSVKKTKRMKQLIHWVNRKQAFWKFRFDEYDIRKFNRG